MLLLPYLKGRGIRSIGTMIKKEERDLGSTSSRSRSIYKVNSLMVTAQFLEWFLYHLLEDEVTVRQSTSQFRNQVDLVWVIFDVLKQSLHLLLEHRTILFWIVRRLLSHIRILLCDKSIRVGMVSKCCSTSHTLMDQIVSIYEDHLWMSVQERFRNDQPLVGFS